MKLMKNFPLLLVGLSVIFTACGQVPANYYDQPNRNVQRPDNLQRVEVTNASMQGTWFSECWSNPGQSGVWMRETMVIYGAGLTSYITAYGDSACAQEQYRITYSASFGLTGNQLTETYAQMSVLPSTASITTLFNSGTGFCGRKNWFTGVPTAISNVSDCGVPKAKTMVLENFANQQLFATSGDFTMKYVRQ